MDKQQARDLIKDTFEQPFDKTRFTAFIKNLLNRIGEAPFTYQGQFIPDAYKPYISVLERIGKYSDGAHKIDILVIKLKKETSLERARTMQRNFVAWYLNGSRGGELKDAALVAFIAPDDVDWRFSLVKMDYKFEQTPSGKMKVKEEFTPARRWSFLVGVNERSHTAQSRLVNILADDEMAPTLAELEEAFNIETVTKEFFLKYRDLFIRAKEALDKVVKNDAGIKADFEAKGVNAVDFAKKLLGQIVFLYFLQKKGWFGVTRDAAWGSGAKQFLRELFEKKHGSFNNFFNDILEPLFYEALRIGEERKQDDYYYSRFNCKIPFLNGGLFDPIGNYDWVNTDIILPDMLFSNTNKTKEGDIGDGMLDIFDRYNFTVKEDEPLEKEVAIDPELLGKAYEKFNAIRPDNFEEYKKALKSGKKGDESKFNKQFGVYYTPRGIVHYMCRQSLINYLATELTDSHSRPVSEHGVNSSGNPVVSREDIETLIHLGEQVSENEARVESKGKETTTYSYKLPENIRNNAGLIDRKLENITVCDPAVGSGAFLVGMMTEIVRARSSLTPYFNDVHERAPYFFKRHAIQNCLYGVDIDLGAVEIAKLRLWLSLVVDEEDVQQIKPLPNLDYKVVAGNSLLGVEKNLFNNDLFIQLEKLKPQFFDETDAKKKAALKQKIDDLIHQLTRGKGIFDFEIYFSEVFQRNLDKSDRNCGFDVVIQNPPYVQIKAIPATDRRVYEKLYKFTTGRFNLFYLFIERCQLLLKRHGIAAFIVPDRLLLNTQCKAIRSWLLNDNNICELVSFADQVFETVVVDSILLLFQREQRTADFVRARRKVAQQDVHKAQSIIIPVSYFELSASSQFDLNYDSSKLALYRKIRANSVELTTISETKDGIIQGKVEDRLFLRGKKDSNSKPLLFGEDIGRYSIVYGHNWVNYKPNEMMALEIERRGKGVRPGLWMRDPRIFERPKILTRQTADKIIAAYDTENFYYSNTLHGTAIIDKAYHPHYLLGFLNSKITTWYYRSNTDEEGKVFAQIKIELLRKLPIPKADKVKQQSVIELVDQILAAKKRDPKADTTALERKIDRLVYELYGLTEDEIAIVEGRE